MLKSKRVQIGCTISSKIRIFSFCDKKTSKLKKKKDKELCRFHLRWHKMADLKCFQAGTAKAKDGWPKCPSAARKSVWLSTRAIDCICKPALRVLAGRKKNPQKNKKIKGAEQCVSKYRTQRAIPPLSCLFYSKCHSVSESAFGALRQRCRCSTLNIYRCGQMGVGFTRAWAGVQKIAQQPPPADWKLLKTITAAEGPW